MARHRPTALETAGIADMFGDAGPYEALLTKYRFDSDAIAAAARKAIARKGR